MERYKLIKNYISQIEKKSKFYLIDSSEKQKIIALLKVIINLEENFGIFVPKQIEKYDILIKIIEIQKIKEETKLEFTKQEEKIYYEKLVQELELWKLEKVVYYKKALLLAIGKKTDIKTHIDSRSEMEKYDQIMTFIIEFEKKYNLVL